MASFVTLSHPPLFLHCSFETKVPSKGHHHLHVRFQIPRRLRYRLLYSRRISNYSSQKGGGTFADRRNWSGATIGDYNYDDDDDDETDEEDEDRSLDLLLRFVQNVFRKISKRARKAVRSVLPLSISTKLVGFSVNGVIILAFLWVMKAFLEVVCTLGTVVFVSILLIRGVWSGVSYIQESRNPKTNRFYKENSTWTGAQPAS